MKRVKSLWDQEPAMFLAVIQAGVSLLVSFGFELSGEQVGAIMAFSAAVVGLITRTKVSPNDTGMRVPTSRLPIILLLAGALSAPACASSGRVLVEVDRGLYASVVSIDNVGNAACDAKLRPEADCKAFNAALAAAYDSYQQFNRAVKDQSLAGAPAMVDAIDGLVRAGESITPQAASAIADLKRLADQLRALVKR